MRKRERRELIPPVSYGTGVSFTVRAALVDSQAPENPLKRHSLASLRSPKNYQTLQ